MVITIEELVSEIPILNPESGKYLIGGPSVASGLDPTPPPRKEGLVLLTPQQLLSLRVNVFGLNGAGTYSGYQRALFVPHARAAARYLDADGKFDPILIALDPDGFLYIVNGQHRAVAAVIARTPITAVIEAMPYEDQRQRFAAQRRSIPINPSLYVLDADDSISLYVHEACIAHERGDLSHPWAELVSPHPNSRNFLTANQVFTVIASYVSATIGKSTTSPSKATPAADRAFSEFDPALADELGRLLSSIGTKTSNHAAFQSKALAATVAMAVLVVRRAEAKDREWALARWYERLPKFRFDRYQSAPGYLLILEGLIAHWNVNLKGRRRIRWGRGA